MNRDDKEMAIQALEEDEAGDEQRLRDSFFSFQLSAFSSSGATQVRTDSRPGRFVVEMD